jgi:putative tricarboxylic transport membrane protein
MWEGGGELARAVAHLALDPGRGVLVLVGVIVGMAAGLLPGITFVMMVLLLLPFTYKMDLVSAVILLTATYLGGIYGGTITAILFNIPGDPDSVPSLWDGYPLARKKGAGYALALAALAGGVGTFFGGLVLATVGPAVARVALQLSTPEFFGVVLVGLASVAALGEPPLWKTFAALAAGVLLGAVGVDEIYGVPRLTWGWAVLRDGIDFVVIMTGVYALGEVIERAAAGFPKEAGHDVGVRVGVTDAVRALRESVQFGSSWLRALLVGTGIGFVPAAGATVAAFVSYGLERLTGRRRHLMGTGIPEGLIAPNAAASATLGGALVPLLTLGIPGSAAAAVILAALTLKGVQPGPGIFREQPDAVYSILATVLIGAVVLVVCGTVGAGLFARLMRVPEGMILAAVMVNGFLGLYLLRYSWSDVMIGLLAGVVGYFMRVYRAPLGALILGLILGPLAEKYFLTTMLSYGNDWSVFLRRPVSALLLVLAGLAFVWGLMRSRGASEGSGSEEKGSLSPEGSG